MRTIKVHGSASVMQKPDWMKVSLGLNTRDEDLQQAFKDLEDSIDTCVMILNQLGLDKDSLTIGSVSVQHYKDYESEKPTFHASQTLTLEQALDTHLIEMLMNEVGKIPSININVNYSIKDAKDYERQALQQAIENATEEARAICDYSNLKLGEIQAIEDVNINVSVRTGLTKASRGFGNESVNLEDVIINQSLTITWEIK